MDNKKNIDRLFQEKLKDFEVAPNDAVWNRISKSLPNKKKKRRVVALWWQVGGVAAAIALLLTVGSSLFNSDGIDPNKDLPIVNTDDKSKDKSEKENNTNQLPKDKQKDLNDSQLDNLEFVDSDRLNETIENTEGKDDKSVQEKTISNKLVSPNKSQLNSVANNTTESPKIVSPKTREDLISVKDDKTKVADNTDNSVGTQSSTDTKLANESEIKSQIKNSIKTNKTAVADNSKSNASENSDSKLSDSKIIDNISNDENALKEDPIKEAITEAIAENKDLINIDEKEEKKSRWSILPNVAPVYYSSLGKGSSIDQQFNDNSKSSDINMSYGVASSYKVSKKLKLRAGVNLVNLSQSTSEVFAFTGPTTGSSLTASSRTTAPPKYPNITFRNGAQEVSLMSAKTMTAASDFGNTGNLDQRLAFVEVPLELEYTLLDKKFGINFIGGFSTFFLSNNEIYADVDGTSTLIGEANNINGTSFSANVGLGLDYNLTKQWNINLEPQFKYQINTFNNTSGNFRPFFIGVYTGLSFKF